MGSYGEGDEVVGGVGAVGDVGVRDDGDPVHGVDAQAGSGTRGRDGDVGARAAEDGDGDERLHGLRARRDRHQHQHLRSAAHQCAGTDKGGYRKGCGYLLDGSERRHREVTGTTGLLLLGCRSDELGSGGGAPWLR